MSILIYFSEYILLHFALLYIFLFENFRNLEAPSEDSSLPGPFTPKHQEFADAAALGLSKCLYRLHNQFKETTLQ